MEMINEEQDLKEFDINNLSNDLIKEFDRLNSDLIYVGIEIPKFFQS